MCKKDSLVKLIIINEHKFEVMKNILGPQGPEFDDLYCSNDELPANLQTIQDLLLHLAAYKSMGPSGIHPRVLRELATALRGLSQCFPICSGDLESSRLTGSWQMVQFSGRGRKQSLVTPGLSDSVWCLAERWRKFCWELLNNS